MIDEAYGWISLMLFTVGGSILILAFLKRSRSDRLYCCGPPVAPSAWLNPMRWFFRSGCWYNLTGLAADEQGAVRCPECGTLSLPNRRLRHTRGTRPAAIGAACIVVGGGSFAVPWFTAGQWMLAIPTFILVLVEHTGHAQAMQPLRTELHRRAMAGLVDSLSARLLAIELAQDLSDDNVRGNAQRAAEILDGLWPASRNALEDALDSSDWQSRIAAAGILRQRCIMDPSDRLLRVCIDDLADDGDAIPWFTTSNAREAVEYLVRFSDRIEKPLAEAIQSDDAQQRFLAAAIAGFGRIPGLAEAAAPVLIEHLRDDRISGNSRIAAPALYCFGPLVLPILRPACDSDDPQLRTIARCITERLEFPDRPLSALENPMPRISETTFDPLKADVSSAMSGFFGLVVESE